jgi:hypothetical protein
MNDSTLLVINGVDISPYASRGLQQTLDPIGAAANLRRTINGALMDLAYPQFRKYRSVISGNDQKPPGVNGRWQGLAVVVDCISELSYLTATGAPDRPVVPGSSHIDGEFTFYRPRLNMRIVNFQQNTDEWGAQCNWSMELEET